MIICRGQFPGKMSTARHIIIEVGVGAIILTHEVPQNRTGETHETAHIVIQTHCQDLGEGDQEEEDNMIRMDHCHGEGEDKEMGATKQIMTIEEEVEEEVIIKEAQGHKVN